MERAVPHRASESHVSTPLLMLGTLTGRGRTGSQTKRRVHRCFWTDSLIARLQRSNVDHGGRHVALVCFCESQTSNKDLMWTTMEASTVKNFLWDFRHCLSQSASSDDTGHRALPRHEAFNNRQQGQRTTPTEALHIASKSTNTGQRAIPRHEAFANRQQCQRTAPTEASHIASKSSNAGQRATPRHEAFNNRRHLSKNHSH